MKRWLHALPIVVALFVPPLAGAADATNDASTLECSDPAFTQNVAPVLSEECCKICHKGKACGDSCIAREKECRQPAGCACDG